MEENSLKTEEFLLYVGLKNFTENKIVLLRREEFHLHVEENIFYEKRRISLKTEFPGFLVILVWCWDPVIFL